MVPEGDYPVMRLSTKILLIFQSMRMNYTYIVKNVELVLVTFAHQIV